VTRVERRIGRRIIVIGSSNAGKSTLAQRLAGRLCVLFVELDALHWEPGWVAAERNVFRERVRRVIAPEAWVLAGNYTRQQQDVSWPVADTVVWLDLGLPTVLWRCIVRSWQRWRSADLLWGTNREVFWEHLMLWNPDKSLIAYIIKTHRARRRRFEALTRDPRWSHLTFIRLRSVEAIDRWLDAIPAQPAHTFQPRETSPRTAPATRE
jgi:adenylate kinase family enzyme